MLFACKIFWHRHVDDKLAQLSPNLSQDIRFDKRQTKPEVEIELDQHLQDQTCVPLRSIDPNEFHEGSVEPNISLGENAQKLSSKFQVQMAMWIVQDKHRTWHEL